MLLVALHMVWEVGFSDICVCAAAIGMLFQIGSFGNESHVSKVQGTVYETETDVHIPQHLLRPLSVFLLIVTIRITFRNRFRNSTPRTSMMNTKQTRFTTSRDIMMAFSSLTCMLLATILHTRFIVSIDQHDLVG